MSTGDAVVCGICGGQRGWWQPNQLMTTGGEWVPCNACRSVPPSPAPVDQPSSASVGHLTPMDDPYRRKPAAATPRRVSDEEEIAALRLELAEITANADYVHNAMFDRCLRSDEERETLRTAVLRVRVLCQVMERLAPPLQQVRVSDLRLAVADAEAYFGAV